MKTRLPAFWPAIVLLLGALALTIIAVVWQTRQINEQIRAQVIAAAEQRSQQLANAIAGQLDGLIGNIDLTLLQLRQEWLDHRQRFEHSAQTFLNALPPGAITHLSVADANGNIVYDSQGSPGRVNVADRPHFRFHLGGGDRLAVGTAVQSRLRGVWSFVVNRPLRREGRFLGTINVLVSVEFLSRQLAGLQLSPDDIIALLHADGSFLARNRDFADAMGKKVAPDRPFLQAGAPVQGVFRMPATLDQHPRIFGWHTLKSGRLHAVVGLSEPALLETLVESQRRNDNVSSTLIIALLLLGGFSLALLLLAGRAHDRARDREAQLKALNTSMEQDCQRLVMLTRELTDGHLDARAGDFDGAAFKELARHFNQMADSLKRQHEELSLSEAREQDFTKSASDWRWETDAEHRFIAPPTDYFFEQYHFTREQVIGKSRANFVSNGSVSQAEWENHQRQLANHEPFRNFEYSLRGNDGVTRWVSVSGVPYFDAAGRFAGYRGTGSNINERKAAEAALREARDEAERANAAKGEFLSRMSHELRTPLNAILGFGQLLASPEGEALSADQAENVAEILKAGQHLLALVNEVLDLARVDSGRIELSLEPVGVAEVVNDCLSQLKLLAAQRGIVIQTVVDPALAVQADHTRMQQVLLNLLSNAIKYNRDGGRIDVTASVEHGRAQVEVRDTGRGIAPEKLAKLFKPFERLESSYDGIEGTGIGLALVKRLVEAMGGEIGVSSDQGAGSTFWFALPAARLPDPATTPVADGDSETGGTPSVQDRRSRRRVLYIEDNPANLKLVGKMLAARPDLVLLEATDAERGLELAARERPDLILLDINLPGMNGFTALQQLQAMPETAAIPVVAITAFGMKHDIERGRAAGFADYLTKPIDLARLSRILDALSAGEP